jgi:hypothetical protein
VWWHLSFDLATVSDAANPDPAPGGFMETLRAVLPDLSRWLEQTYGVFGWLDTVSPDISFLTWVALGSATFALVVLGSKHRLRVVSAVGLGVALWAAVPLAFSVTVGREVGIHFWQGRYTMPFAQGIPLALGVLGASWPAGRTELARLLRVASPAAWLQWPVLGTLTFVWAVHRFTDGEGSDWNLASPSWSPPGGVVLLVALYLLAGTALVLSLRDTGQAPQCPILTPPQDDQGRPAAETTVNDAGAP